MSIREIEFNPERLRKKGLVLPAEIEKDPWVLYHGTSSIAEERIETEGLGLLGPPYTIEELEKVLSIFDGLYWEGPWHDGSGFGGYGVLKEYSIGFDYDSDGRKKTFFHRIPRFFHSTQECSGGETARALRFAFKHLHEYQSNIKQLSPLVRRWKNILAKRAHEHLHPELKLLNGANPPPASNPVGRENPSVEEVLQGLKQFKDGDITTKLLASLIALLKTDFKWPTDAFPKEPSKERLKIPSDAEWLKTGLDETKDLQERCLKPFNNFRHGIIYAVKFSKSDLAGLTLEGDGFHSMGIHTSKTIEPKQIVAKVVIPSGKNPHETEWNLSNPLYPGYIPRGRLEHVKSKDRDGLYYKLAKRQKKRI